MDNETRDLAVKREDGLLAMAIEKGISDPDILAKLIALRNDELARQSKAVFDEKFAAMQAIWARHFSALLTIRDKYKAYAYKGGK